MENFHRFATWQIFFFLEDVATFTAGENGYFCNTKIASFGENFL